MAVNTGKIQGKHREFNLNLNVATLIIGIGDYDLVSLGVGTAFACSFFLLSCEVVSPLHWGTRK